MMEIYGVWTLLVNSITFIVSCCILCALKSHFTRFYHQFKPQLLFATIFISLPLLLASIGYIVFIRFFDTKIAEKYNDEFYGYAYICLYLVQMIPLLA